MNKKILILLTVAGLTTLHTYAMKDEPKTPNNTPESQSSPKETKDKDEVNMSGSFIFFKAAVKHIVTHTEKPLFPKVIVHSPKRDETDLR